MNEFPHSPRARATASGADSLTARAVAVGFEPEHLGAYIRVDSDLGEEGGDAAAGDLFDELAELTEAQWDSFVDGGGTVLLAAEHAATGDGARIIAHAEAADEVALPGDPQRR